MKHIISTIGGAVGGVVHENKHLTTAYDAE